MIYLQGMTGQKQGCKGYTFAEVQQKIQDIAPQAIYIHCTENVLNLDWLIVQNVSGAAELFALLQSLYTFVKLKSACAIFTMAGRIIPR